MVDGLLFADFEGAGSGGAGFDAVALPLDGPAAEPRNFGFGFPLVVSTGGGRNGGPALRFEVVDGAGAVSSSSIKVVKSSLSSSAARSSSSSIFDVEAAGEGVVGRAKVERKYEDSGNSCENIETYEKPKVVVLSRDLCLHAVKSEKSLTSLM